MRFKHITAVFLGLSLFSVVLRAIQLLVATNMSNGFLIAATAQNTVGNVISVILLLTVAVAGIVASQVRRCPRKMPKMRPPLMISSLFCGACMLFTSVYQMFFVPGRSTLSYAMVLLGILAAAVFILYALQERTHFRFHGAFFAIPVIYCIARLISVFMTVTSVTSMWNNFVWALCECSQLAFLLELGKTANDMSANEYKRFLVVSFCAMISGLTYSVPTLLIYLPNRIMNGKSITTVLASAVLALGITAFECAFTFSFFANRNLKNRSHRKYRRQQSDDSAARFYLGDEDKHRHHHHRHTDIGTENVGDGSGDSAAT